MRNLLELLDGFTPPQSQEPLPSRRAKSYKIAVWWRTELCKRRRERQWIIEFARDIAAVATMPLMVTGGIRRREVAEKVIESGVAMAGIATARAIEPNLPRSWRLGKSDAPALKPITWKNKAVATSAHMAAVRYQLVRLSRSRPTAPNVSPVWALLTSQMHAKHGARQYRRWIAQRKAEARPPRRSEPSAGVAVDA